ncbi:MAG TPA: MFS transporter [Thermomicrobiales bacterium]|jgi:MFS family permease|nr:MFS transporter [Thermomicrobiales bacterium]
MATAARATRGGWYRLLSVDGREAFWGAFAGVALAGFDVYSFSYVLGALHDAFGVSSAQLGLLATASLMATAFGSAIGGVLADRIGRVPTMIGAVAVYAVFSIACGLAPTYAILLVCRIVVGLGFGADWTASSLIVAEYADPAARGRTIAALTSSFTVGNLLAALIAAVFAAALPEGLDWRALFLVGGVPAVLTVFYRLKLKESPVYRAHRTTRTAHAPWLTIVRPPLERITLGAVILTIGVLAGPFIVLIWLPSYLRGERGFSVTLASLAMIPLQIGGWFGFMVDGALNDAIGRRRTFAFFALGSAVFTIGYVALPSLPWLLLAGAVPLGFCINGIVGGTGAYLAELYPTPVRGIGQGLSYSAGRAIAAAPLALVGDLATGIGLGTAIGASALLYALVFVALPLLPETNGKQFESG